MAKYLKPQTPLQHQSGDYIYPLTTVDQVIIDKDNRLNSLFKKTIKEIATLQVAGWSDTKPYTQTITLNHSVDDYDVDANVAYGDEDNAALHAAAGCLSYIKKNNNTITFYCLKKKPDIDIPVEISGTCRNTIADITIEEGIDTSDATATAEDILSGKTAYANGNKITGNYEGVELNFEVVGGTTQPTNPTENMIWVNTDIEITSWLFSAVEPTEHVEGMVWFSIGNASNITFNTLKENGVQVHAIFAKQYKNNIWATVNASIYQNNKWTIWFNGSLYYYGEEFKDYTGGWESNPNLNFNGDLSVGGTVTKNIDSITVKSNSYLEYYSFETVKPIDLTRYSTITCIGSCPSWTIDQVKFCVHNFKNGYAGSGSIVSNITKNEQSFDISALTGYFYISIGCWNAGTYTLYHMYLE